RISSERQCRGSAVDQMCWMKPGPSISAIVIVSLPRMSRQGDFFHPMPRSREAWAVECCPRSARLPPPGSPVGFSALMERVRASESTDRPPGPNGAGCVMRDPFDGVVSAGSGHAEVVLRGDVLLGEHLPPQIAQAA